MVEEGAAFVAAALLAAEGDVGSAFSLFVPCDDDGSAWSGASNGSEDGSGARKRGEGGRAGGLGEGMLGIGNSVWAIWKLQSLAQAALVKRGYLVQGNSPFQCVRGWWAAAEARRSCGSSGSEHMFRISIVVGGCVVAREHSLVHGAIQGGLPQDVVASLELHPIGHC